MDITFYDDPGSGPRSRAEVRILQIGLYVYPDLRRLAFGVELTPFLERPSLEVKVTNSAGVEAASLHVIETLSPNFNITLHLRDDAPSDPYELKANVYYATPETSREDVDARAVTFEAREEGEKLFSFDE